MWNLFHVKHGADAPDDLRSLLESNFAGGQRLFARWISTKTLRNSRLDFIVVTHPFSHFITVAKLKKKPPHERLPLKDIRDNRLSEVAGRLRQSCNYGNTCQIRRRHVLKYIWKKSNIWSSHPSRSNSERQTSLSLPVPTPPPSAPLATCATLSANFKTVALWAARRRWTRWKSGCSRRCRC